ncbi:hypothetical protein Pmani_015782 [Petrolisthes manimaculis]|uniref:Uncharacterized protein n=1 Tax=Petrolisthes manimaculis TaxID=1843537 RepID=A0AAE1U7B8_9EUCA|nr:hypothetical protein Pmani_015782 [Petrolisthes manimaculis]
MLHGCQSRPLAGARVHRTALLQNQQFIKEISPQITQVKKIIDPQGSVQATSQFSKEWLNGRSQPVRKGAVRETTNKSPNVINEATAEVINGSTTQVTNETAS